MRINDLLVESQVDEISLAGVGQGIANAARSAAKGYGYVKGIPKALSAASQQGQAAAMANLGYGKFGTAPAADRTAYNQELAKRMGTQAGTAPAQDPASLRKQAQDLRKQSNDLMKAAKDAENAVRAQQIAATQAQAQQQKAQAATPAQPATTINAPTATVPATNTTMPTNMAVPKPAAAPAQPSANFSQGGYGKTTTNVAPQKAKPAPAVAENAGYSRFLGIEL
jgi:hypothetical protein